MEISYVAQTYHTGKDAILSLYATPNRTVKHSGEKERDDAAVILTIANGTRKRQRS
jgi:hypothetical protein